MSKKVLQKYLPLAKLLTKNHIPRRSFESLINSLDESAIKFLCECIQNAITLKHISRLNTKKKALFLKTISPNKKVLKHLCKKRNNYKGSRKIIAQRGYGFLLPILSAIIPLAASLLIRR